MRVGQNIPVCPARCPSVAETEQAMRPAVLAYQGFRDTHKRVNGRMPERLKDSREDSPMKMRSLFPIALLLACVLFAQDSRAEDYTRWNLPEGALARLGKGKLEVLGINNAVAYSPDGTRLSVVTGLGIWLYDAGTGTEVALLQGHTSGVRSVAFSPDGQTLASGGLDATVRL